MLEAPNEIGAGQGSLQMINSTAVNGHQHAADQKKLKNSILADAEVGLPVDVTLSPGRASDLKGCSQLMDQVGLNPKVMLADKGHNTDAIRQDRKQCGVEPIIPFKTLPKNSRANRRLPLCPAQYA